MALSSVSRILKYNNNCINKKVNYLVSWPSNKYKTNLNLKGNKTKILISRHTNSVSVCICQHGWLLLMSSAGDDEWQECLTDFVTLAETHRKMIAMASTDLPKQKSSCYLFYFSFSPYAESSNQAPAGSLLAAEKCTTFFNHYCQITWGRCDC